MLLRVEEVKFVTKAVKVFRLVEKDGAKLPEFNAGAHIKVMATLANGLEDERCYSLVNSHNQTGYYEIAVQLERHSRGGSIFMHNLKVGDEIRVKGLGNDFPLVQNASHHVLIAGGIGITPILSMANVLQAAGQSFELHYGARVPELMTYKKELEALDDNVSLYFDNGDPKQGMSLFDIVGSPVSGRHIYVCGPRGMVDALIDMTKKQDWDPANVHFELFNAPTSQKGDTTFELKLADSGLTLQVPPDKTILDVMLEAGLDPMFDCRRGECSSCVMEVLEGEPDHRDYVLSDEDQQSNAVICICVSRANTGKLVIKA